MQKIPVCAWNSPPHYHWPPVDTAGKIDFGVVNGGTPLKDDLVQFGIESNRCKQIAGENPRALFRNSYKSQCNMLINNIVNILLSAVSQSSRYRDMTGQVH